MVSTVYKRLSKERKVKFRPNSLRTLRGFCAFTLKRIMLRELNNRNNKIHIIGGEDLKKGITFGQHDIYDLNTKEWSKDNDLKIARHGFIAELFENKWYIYGGGKKAGIKTLISTTANLERLDL